jgi:Uma2 family endonuclease
LRARRATLDELIARGDTDRLEIIGGEIVDKAIPSPLHSFTELKLGVAVDPYNRKPGGRRGPGGWWIFGDIHTGYQDGEMYCHDAAAWRRDRVAARPDEWPVRVRPDWVCEIVSPTQAIHDRVTKPRTLHAAEVGHYWLLEPEEQLLRVHRWSPEGYVVIQQAGAGETIRAEPFEEIEIRVAMLFGDDDDE